jgi:hypothetical protein
MTGHEWQPAEGTVINSHTEQMGLPGKHGMRWVTVHEIVVRTQAGDAGRARLLSEVRNVLRPGTAVRLEISETTGEVRLHPDRDRLIIGVDPAFSVSGEDSGTAAGPALDPAGRDSAQIRLREMSETEREASRETATRADPAAPGDQT